MKLNDEEKAMLAGELGVVAKTAIEHQIKVGTFFHAEDFVPVTQAHIMADTESLGRSGVEWLESLAAQGLISNPRGRAESVFLSPEGLARLFKPFSQADSTTTRVFGGTAMIRFCSIFRPTISSTTAPMPATSTPILSSSPESSHCSITSPTSTTSWPGSTKIRSP